jgi:hypothetical protein
MSVRFTSDRDTFTYEEYNSLRDTFTYFLCAALVLICDFDSNQ